MRIFRRGSARQFFPIPDSALEIAEIIGGEAGQHQCAPVRRIDAQRFINGVLRFPIKAAVVEEGTGIGVLGPQSGIAAARFQGSLVGQSGLCILAKLRVSACQQGPAVSVVRLLLQASLQPGGNRRQFRKLAQICRGTR
ncbi:MAG: hypothetical protein K0S28_1601 [Paucimonas sp.]|nr:hypothetical protein [Paucimonas sp.]